MKKMALIIAACLCAALVFAGGKKEDSSDGTVKIGISKIVQHLLSMQQNRVFRMQ